MRSGDWGNLFILANSGLFLASVILQNAGVVDWHSAALGRVRAAEVDGGRERRRARRRDARDGRLVELAAELDAQITRLAREEHVDLLGYCFFDQLSAGSETSAWRRQE